MKIVIKDICVAILCFLNALFIGYILYLLYKYKFVVTVKRIVKFFVKSK